MFALLGRLLVDAAAELAAAVELAGGAVVDTAAEVAAPDDGARDDPALARAEEARAGIVTWTPIWAQSCRGSRQTSLLLLDSEATYLLAKRGASGGVSSIALRGEALSDSVDEDSGTAEASRVALRRIRVSSFNGLCLSSTHSRASNTAGGADNARLEAGESRQARISNQFRSRDVRL